MRVEETQAAAEYVLGHEDRELQRLMLQVQMYAPLTESVLRGAGIKPGMRVLDVGCGVGDVSLLAAELVGPTGEVVGVDREARVLAGAQRRAREQGLSQVRFHQSSLESLPVEAPFDAIVSRLVLMFQPDPVSFVRRMAEHLRPGGVMALQELELAAMGMSHPKLPLFARIWSWMLPTCERVGIKVHMGLELVSTLRRAGLVVDDGVVGGRLGVTPDADPTQALVETVRTLLPHMERLGVALAMEVDIDTLAARLTAELRANNGVLMPSVMVGVWGHRPGPV
ncbi:class I SAM-dependent methyltransferase [Corallococcus aberystwythensis]|uniref:Class I SAM-dependent methyltransferase n=1 Tax=Corallococcus aberystwythensis TaxID=2316722 RepID=A0A3A8PTX6_9BACT|nr:class I SAM-dependent methyltransferase [Corallococcus aberystwythensis]RKH58381.1 class I SAM-dependent methyltransferase [Corallococcus aberystwythensis]